MNTPQTIDSFSFKDSPKVGFPQLARWICGWAIFALLAGCAGPDPLDKLAGEHQLVRGVLQSGEFTLATLSKKLPAQLPELRVYIGSDGQPWQRQVPGVDPTGRHSLAAELMVQDPQPALYLGRPCYHTGAGNPPCESSLWTSGRYSQTVINTMAVALQEIIQTRGVKQLTLVGYSGGGVVALLAATRLERALFATPLKLRVYTVASNLDIEAWSEFHQHLPLVDSLNPVQDVPSTSGFRQIHLVGRADRVVPANTIQRYLRTHRQATVWYFDDFNHVCCWAQQWPELLARLDARVQGANSASRFALSAVSPEWLARYSFSE
jgi:hypothetical protein